VHIALPYIVSHPLPPVKKRRPTKNLKKLLTNPFLYSIIYLEIE